jgi:hypothetical protein
MRSSFIFKAKIFSNLLIGVGSVTQENVHNLSVTLGSREVEGRPLVLVRTPSHRQTVAINTEVNAVFRIRIHLFLGLLDPDPDSLVRGMDPDPDPALDPDPDPDPSIIMQN